MVSVCALHPDPPSWGLLNPSLNTSGRYRVSQSGTVCLCVPTGPGERQVWAEHPWFSIRACILFQMLLIHVNFLSNGFFLHKNTYTPNQHKVFSSLKGGVSGWTLGKKLGTQWICHEKMLVMSARPGHCDGGSLVEQKRTTSVTISDLSCENSNEPEESSRLLSSPGCLPSTLLLSMPPHHQANQLMYQGWLSIPGSWLL